MLCLTPRTVMAVVAAVALAACGGEVEYTEAAPSAPQTNPAAKLSLAVSLALEASGPQEVLVVYDGSAIETRARAEQGLAFPSEARAEREARGVIRKAAFDDAKTAIHSRMDPRTFALVHDYDQLPVSLVRVDSLGAALALAAEPDVVQLHENFASEAFADENLAIINQPAAVQAGFAGLGSTIVVIDTGLDYARPEFGTCPTAGVAGCRVSFVGEVAPEDDVLDDPAMPHGSATAATAGSVAPGAMLIGLDVFSGAYAYDSDILKAINWSIANRALYNIEAINLSLGGGKYVAACPGFAATEAIKAARAVGILTAVASGNNGYLDSLAYPACGPAALSVGATTAYGQVLNAKAVLADTVTYYSNASKLLTLLAPGSAVATLGSVWHGTSFAAPHVAGAIATLAAAYPDDSPDQLQSRLVVSANSILDTRNKLTFPRIDLAAATQPCLYAVTKATATVSPAGGAPVFAVTTSNACGWTAVSSAAWLTPDVSAGAGSAALTVSAQLNNSSGPRTGTVAFAGKTLTFTQAKDTTAPTGSLLINGGAMFTNNLAVSLAITAVDINGVAQMCVSNGTTCGAWEAFAATKAWKLATVDGKKTVRVWLKDGVGNASSAALTAVITFDSTGPTGGLIKTAPLDGALNVTWSGFVDTLSGVASYKAVFSEGTVAPTSCLLGTEVYAGAELKFTHAGLTNGTTYAYRVCGIDKLGKLGAGVVGLGKPVPFTEPPTGSVVINGGAANTSQQAVTLTITGASQGTVTQMCVSNTVNCVAWIPFATSHVWTVAPLNGTKTVNVWLRDNWGNTLLKPVADTIVWDNVAPAGGALAATGSLQKVTLTWTGIKDVTTGIANYTIVATPGVTAPASCSAGDVLYSGTGFSFVHGGLPDASTYSYRLCTTDKTGNASVGLTKTATTQVAMTPAPAP